MPKLEVPHYMSVKILMNSENRSACKIQGGGQYQNCLAYKNLLQMKIIIQLNLVIMS